MHGKNWWFERRLFAVAVVICVAVGTETTAAGAVELPNGRRYEVVSPPERRAGDVMALSFRTRAGEDGNAVAFSSLTGFGDVRGMGVSSEYLAVRSVTPETNGWTTHGITPPQGSLSFGAHLTGGEPKFRMFTPDLSAGVFQAWTPLTDVPEVANVANLYVVDGMRSPGADSYELVTACPACVTPFSLLSQTMVPWSAGASLDLEHVIFESTLNLADAASGVNTTELYESVAGSTRLAGVLPDGTAATRSIAGQGVSLGKSTGHPIAADGSRVIFTAPSRANFFSGPLYQRVNGRATVQLNASERATPDAVEPATYWDASTDGSRVFFTSAEALTDGAPNDASAKLYMWQRQSHDEVQSVTIDATGGVFTLAARGLTTAPIPFDADAGTVEAELEALRSIGDGNVSVSGGPGGSSPYLVAFTGDLAGVNIGELTTDATLLTGGAGTAIATTTRPVRNLTQLDVDAQPADGIGGAVEGVIGIGDAGEDVYFVAMGQRVAGVPSFTGVGVFHWHEGAIDYVGAIDRFASVRVGNLGGADLALVPRQTQVTPDGRHVLFVSRSGVGLLSAHGGIDYDHGVCDVGGCEELYVYSADSRTLRCASCNPSGAPATVNAAARLKPATVIGGTQIATYLSRPLSDDGRFVFFSSAEALVPEDVNGRIDAYEYDVASGTVGLLTSGTNTSDSWFLDASANGNDVFFATREQLVGWDDNNYYDLYDARVGGGFADPPTSASGCSGDTCQGTAGNAPAPASVGSAAVRGEGDASGDEPIARPQRRQCKRGKVRKRVHGKARCVKHCPRGTKRKQIRGNARCVRRTRSRRARRAHNHRHVVRERRTK